MDISEKAESSLFAAHQAAVQANFNVPSGDSSQREKRSNALAAIARSCEGELATRYARRALLQVLESWPKGTKLDISLFCVSLQAFGKEKEGTSTSAAGKAHKSSLCTDNVFSILKLLAFEDFLRQNECFRKKVIFVVVIDRRPGLS